MKKEKEELDLTQDPQEGIAWETPQCVHCKYNLTSSCMHYKLDRMEVPVDIFNCPHFIEENEEDKKIKNLIIKAVNYFRNKKKEKDLHKDNEDKAKESIEKK